MSAESKNDWSCYKEVVGVPKKGHIEANMPLFHCACSLK